MFWYDSDSLNEDDWSISTSIRISLSTPSTLTSQKLTNEMQSLLYEYSNSE